MRTMNYTEALEFIHGRDRFGEYKGLDRMRELMASLGNPQDDLKFIHVAGTNGKGSTVNLIASALRVAGYKTGMYISPFVEEFGERMQINGKNIPDNDLADLTEKVKNAIDVLDGKGTYPPVTEFEAVTAVAFCYYAKEKCDVVVLEVGLGGRFDATNIIKEPLVSVITSISLDHTAILGDTYAKIAEEKCGIIKKECLVVLYPVCQNDVLEVVENKCDEMNAPFILPNVSLIKNQKIASGGASFNYKEVDLTVSLAGVHQVYNAVTAYEALSVLRQNGMKIEDEHIKDGFSACKFFGRLYKLTDNIIFDGAHNPDGIDALCDYIDSFVDGNLIVVMGMVKDKEYPYCIKKIASLADEYIAVEVSSPRKLLWQDNLEEAKKYCGNSKGYADVEKAIKDVMDKLSDNDTLIICGSLYLLGEAKIVVERYLL